MKPRNSNKTTKKGEGDKTVRGFIQTHFKSSNTPSSGVGGPEDYGGSWNFVSTPALMLFPLLRVALPPLSAGLLANITHHGSVSCIHHRSP
jgi:hypothetical protein